MSIEKIVIKLRGSAEEQNKEIDELKPLKPEEDSIFAAELEEDDFDALTKEERKAIVDRLLKLGITLHYLKEDSTYRPSPEQSAKRLRARMERVKKEFLDTFPAVLSGSAPEKSFEKTFLQSEPQLLEAIRNEPGLLLIEDETKSFAVLNLRAIRWVIERHQNFFPSEAVENPEQWAEMFLRKFYQGRSSDVETLEKEEIYYGLLSGFELESVRIWAKKHAIYKKIENELKSRKIEGELPQEFEYFRTLQLPEKRTHVLMQELVEKGFISEHEKEVLLIPRVRTKKAMPFVSYDEKAADRFEPELQNRKEQCQLKISDHLQTVLKSI